MEKTALLSDIHGNAVALRAVLDDVRAQGCRRVFVLGDIINGMDPSICIALLKEVENLHCIKGNAEHYVLTPDLEALSDRIEMLYPGLLDIIGWWRQHMTQTDIEFIRAVPEFLHIDGWYMVHDSPMDRVAVQQMDLGGIDEKYRQLLFHGVGIPQNIPADELDQILNFMDEKDLTGLFVGHTHQPFIKHLGSRVISNLGSVGFTLDGDPRPSWVLCEGDGLQPHFSIRRVPYDIDRAIHRLMEVGFLDFAGEHRQNAYIKMLQTGVHWSAHL